MTTSTMNREEIIAAPRSLLHSLFQFSLIVTMIIAFSELLWLHFSNENSDISFLLFFSTFFVMIVAIPSYFMEKYRTLLIINKDQNVMRKVKKGQTIITYDLDTVEELTIQRIFEPSWCEIKLILKSRDGQETDLFKEAAAKQGTSWEKFARSLSRFIDKPLNEEKWSIDYNGKKTLLPHGTAKIKKKNFIFLFTFLIIPFIGALIFRFNLHKEIFILIGCLVILIYMAFGIYIAFKDKSSLEKLERKVNLVGLVLRLIIQSVSLYFLYTFILNIKRFLK